MAQSTPIRNNIVLVVEDEPLLRMLAVEVVEDAGFEAIEAANADAAIAILESRNDIRLVFTDIDMPGTMDGVKLAEAIRDRWPPISIIVTSGQIAAANVFLPDGAVFFSKPYSTSKVAHTMRAMVMH